MKKILWLLLGLVLAGSFVFWGCSKASPAAGTEKPVVEFYHGYYQDESEWAVAAEMRRIYQEFADANKDEFTFKPVVLDTGAEGVYNRALQEIAVGRFYDVADFGGWNIVPVAAAQDMLLDLKPSIDADGDFKAGIGICYTQNIVNGKIYSVREQVEAIGFWYNEELFKKAGAAPPSEWTVQADFAAAVQKLKASGDIETPFALNHGWPTNLLFTQILLGTREGRDMINNPVTDFGNDAFRNALQFLNTSALQQIQGKYFTSGGESDEQYRDIFIDGKAAMLFNGVWEAGDLGDAKFRPAVFPASESGKKTAIMSAGTGLVVNGKMDPAKTAAAVKFIKYMTSKPVAERILKKSIGMPPGTVVDYAALKADTSLNATTKKLIEACELIQKADYQGLTIGARWDMDIEGAIAGKYAGLKDGSKTVEQVITELNQGL
jgi:ABC-type glycerol-3-phosphate transport system substrate-binding protein